MLRKAGAAAKNIFLTGILIFLIQAIYAQNMDTRLQYEKVDKLHNEAIELARKKRFNESIALFKEAIKYQDLSSSTLFYNLGFAYQVSGDKENAIKAYEEALRRKSDMHNARFQAGRLSCEIEDYKTGVAHGEKLEEIKYKKNKLKDWLPACKEKLTAQNNTPDGEKKSEKKDNSKPPEQYFIEFGYSYNQILKYNLSAKEFTTHRQDAGIKYPMKLYADLDLNQQMKLHFHIRTPYSGLNLPPVITLEENIEFMFLPGSFIFGAGILVSQANTTARELPVGQNADESAFLTNTSSSMNDAKLGLIIGVKTETSQSLLKIYPRYLFRDSSTDTGTSFDKALLGFEYRSFPAEKGLPFGMAFGANFDEFYVTEYEIAGKTVGHFFGTLDLSVELEFGLLIPKQGEKIKYSFGFNFTERFYFQDLNDTDPFLFGNGQGFLGLDVRQKIGTIQFPGHRSNSHIFTLFSKQLYFYHLFAKQSISFEWANPKEGINGLYFELTIGGKF